MNSQAIAERTRAVRALREKAQLHPMCFKFSEGPHYATVYFPEGDVPVAGIRVALAMGKAKAFYRLIEEMERIWEASYP